MSQSICKHSLAKHTANAVALRNTPDKTPRAKQLVARLAMQRFLTCSASTRAANQSLRTTAILRYQPSGVANFSHVLAHGKPILRQFLPLAQLQNA